MSAPAPTRSARPPMDDRIRERRRAVAAAGARRRRRIAGSVLVVVLLAAGAFAITRSPLFAVDEVRVLGVAGDRAEQVRTVAAVAPGERLLSVDLEAVRASVAGLPWVRDAVVTRVPPSTVQVAVAAREPVAVVALPGATWLLDAEGVVVGGGARDGLVVVDAPASVLPGPGVRVSDAAVRNALAFHLALPGPVRALVDRYEAPSDRGLRLHLADEGVWVRVGRAERVEAKARVIGLLLDQAREQAAAGGDEGLGVAELDVRAPENPVLVPGSPGEPTTGEPAEGAAEAPADGASSAAPEA
jgi:cell division protein FtsQ